MTPGLAPQAGTVLLGGSTEVARMGFGAMRITGPGVWGDPPDRAAAIAVLRRVVELGVTLIDTADSYGPAVSEELIREALHTGRASQPYGEVVVATKAGLVRTGPGQWHAVGRPEYLRQCAEMSLRRLGVDCLDVFQLHRIDPQVPAEEQFGVLAALVEEGKVRHVGLSEVSVAELDAAREVVDIATVQNRYNLLDRASEPVLARCEELGIAFLPWFPIATGSLADPDGEAAGTIRSVAAEVGASPVQVALAWLLHHASGMLPIPGTGSLAHLEENVAAAGVRLDGAQLAALDALA